MDRMKCIFRLPCLALMTLLCAISAQATVTINSADFPLKQSSQDGNLYVPGEVGVYVNVPAAGTYTFELYAQGTPLDNVYPMVGLSINTFVKQEQTVGEFPALYTYTGDLTPGVHQIGWFLHNDASNGTEDRNVYIAYMTITPPAGGSDVSLSTRTAWATAAQARENQAVSDSAAAIDTYRKGPATIRVVDQNGQALNGATVTVQQLTHSFRFGASTAALNNLGSSSLNTTYANKFKALFNYATVPMYWSIVEPVQGQYNFAGCDAQVAWAISNNMRVKAHAVLYALDQALPAWMNGVLPDTQTQLDHITLMMQRYSTSCGTWEIVNEPMDAPGMDTAAAQNWAHSLVPSAELGINEYGEFYNGYPELFAFLQSGVNAGVPFDFIGLQAHAPLDAAFPLDRVRDILSYYSTLGKPIHITEFCPSSGGYAVTGNPWRSTWTEATQADYAEKFYRVCFASPSVEAISWWDVCDAQSWCPQGGLLRTDGSSKPSYDKLNSLINTEWRTNLSGSSDTSGAYAFRGFYGTHRISATFSGITQTADVAVTKGAANDYTLTLNVPVGPPPPTVTVNRLTTKNTKPTLTGTVTNATSVSVKVGTKTYTAAVSNGNWSVTLTTSLTAGTYDIVATATASNGTKVTDTTTGELIIDITVPVITITGSSSITIKRNSTYVDQGATATDNIDGNITSRIVTTSTVNTKTTGTYYVKYNVTDTAGNAASTKTRTVKVTN